MYIAGFTIFTGILATQDVLMPRVEGGDMSMRICAGCKQRLYFRKLVNQLCPTCRAQQVMEDEEDDFAAPIDMGLLALSMASSQGALNETLSEVPSPAFSGGDGGGFSGGGASGDYASPEPSSSDSGSCDSGSSDSGSCDDGGDFSGGGDS